MPARVYRKTGLMYRYSRASIRALACAVHSTRAQMPPALACSSLIQPLAGLPGRSRGVVRLVLVVKHHVDAAVAPARLRDDLVGVDEAPAAAVAGMELAGRHQLHPLGGIARGDLDVAGGDQVVRGAREGQHGHNATAGTRTRRVTFRAGPLESSLRPAGSASLTG